MTDASPATRGTNPNPGASQQRTESPTLHLECWWDAALARDGHAATGDYVEIYWLPVLGPSTTLLLRWCARRLPPHRTGLALPLAEIARHLGVGRSGARNGPVMRSFERLCHFQLARSIGDRVEVRAHVPELPDRLARRLPQELRDTRVASCVDRPTAMAPGRK